LDSFEPTATPIGCSSPTLGCDASGTRPPSGRSCMTKPSSPRRNAPALARSTVSSYADYMQCVRGTPDRSGSG
jgi:hypothetical protein